MLPLSSRSGHRMKKSIPIAAALSVAISLGGAVPVHADTSTPFPHVVNDPFAHGVETIQQPDEFGRWVDVTFVCAGKPLRLIAPETPEASETAFNRRLASGSMGVLLSGALPVDSSSMEFANSSALGWRSGDSYQFVYYADAARGSKVRLNFDSGGVPFTVPYFSVTSFC